MDEEAIKNIKCKYCGRVREMAEEVQIDPETSGYEYVCPHCAKMFGKD